MERIFIKDSRNMLKVLKFLDDYHLRLDGQLDELYVLRDKGKIIASGGFYKNTLKNIAVKENDTFVINQVMTFLINREYSLGRTDLFIYTKPEISKSFEYFGFKKIAQTENVVLLENKIRGLNAFKSELRKTQREGHSGAVVVNCNPFTLGHKHLIEYAAKHCDHLHVFVVWEDASTFPNEVRYDLISKGISHLTNVSLHKGDDYIISNVTFPSYFLKDDKETTKEQACLDLNIFRRHIAKTLNIRTRFVGDEPFNETTNKYNEMMIKELKVSGIDVVVIPRLKNMNTAISASKVRELIYLDDFDGIKELVPKSTYDFLKSKEAYEVIKTIKNDYDKKNLV